MNTETLLLVVLFLALSEATTLSVRRALIENSGSSTRITSGWAHQAAKAVDQIARPALQLV